MADIFSKKKRSEVMSMIRSKNTSPEKVVFAYLRTNGIYFQKHYRKVSGTPDVAIPSRKIAVFVDGDFWHGWQFPRWERRLAKGFWRKKINRNRQRDSKNFAKLRRRGWKVLRVWEHQLKGNVKEGTLKRLATLLQKDPRS